MQFIRGWSSLSTGLRILPVAVTIALGSVVGSVLAGRIGTRTVVTTGLVIFGVAFAWIALSPTFMSYGEIVGQMALMGTGLGLTTAPATESILSVLPPAKTGVGSAVNDATREAGGTLGVAVVGSVFTTLYARHIGATAFAHAPAAVLAGARGSVAYAVGAVHAAPGQAQSLLLSGLDASFMHGMHVACLVVAIVCWVGALGALALPGRAADEAAVPVLEPAAA
jgi:hypothetical protein